MTDVSVELQAWTALRTSNLSISPSLVEASHTFGFEGRTVTVTLPSSPKSGQDDQKSISCNAWRMVDGQKIPLQFNVEEVQVTVSVPGSHNLPADVLERRPNAFDLIDEARQQKLNTLASEHLSIAERAFDRWARTMRWKTRQWDIARGGRESIKINWGSTLRQAGTGMRLWTHHDPIVICMDTPVTADQWHQVGDTLAAGGESPVFFDLLSDAEMHFDAGDIRRSVIDAAVSAETYIRFTVLRTLPEAVGDRVREIIDEANIRPVTTKVFPEALQQLGHSPVDKDTMSQVHQLLDARNKLLHTGHAVGMDSDKCAKYIQAVRKLIDQPAGSPTHGH